jgi:hypothetical protein
VPAAGAAGLAGADDAGADAGAAGADDAGDADGADELVEGAAADGAALDALGLAVFLLDEHPASASAIHTAPAIPPAKRCLDPFCITEIPSWLPCGSKRMRQQAKAAVGPKRVSGAVPVVLMKRFKICTNFAT